MTKCAYCQKQIGTPFHITEISADGSVNLISACEICGQKIISGIPKEIDLTVITTTDELLDFILGTEPIEHVPCKCGMTIQALNKHGRLGCAHCYTHFQQRIDELMVSHQDGAESHVGKQPKKQTEDESNTPVEKLKLLKLKFAKALELEEYEKLTDLQSQIDALTQEISSTSEGQ